MSKDYNEEITAWGKEPLQNRLIKARVLLYCHSFISESECRKIDARLDKAFGAQKSAEIVDVK